MKGGDTVKKLMSIIVSILFAFSLTGLCYAQDKPVAPAPEKKAEEKAEKKCEKKKVKKEKKAKKAKKEKKAEKKAEEPAPAPAPEKK
jgi:outer membrane biosynthesis protein TonB